MKDRDVVIIGAGPAGIAAAIQVKRYGVEPIVFEKEIAGGLLGNANLVENYPGFPDGINGTDLIKLFKKQLKTCGVKVIFEEVIKLDYTCNKKTVFLIKTVNRTIKSRIVIISTGTIPKKIPDTILSTGVRDRILYEIYSIRKIRNKRIAIIGAGDAAFDYALNLSKFNRILLLNRSQTLKCIPLLWERSKKVQNISYYDNISVKKINLNQKQLHLEYMQGTYKKLIKTDYVVSAIGRTPATGFLSKKIKRDTKKLISAKLLYFIGDVKNSLFRQVAISVGDGVKAAMEICKDLKEK